MSLPAYVRSLAPRVLTQDTAAVLLDSKGQEREYHDLPSGTQVYVEAIRREYLFDSPAEAHEGRVVTFLVEDALGSFYRYRATEPGLTEATE